MRVLSRPVSELFEEIIAKEIKKGDREFIGTDNMTAICIYFPQYFPQKFKPLTELSQVSPKDDAESGKGDGIVRNKDPPSENIQLGSNPYPKDSEDAVTLQHGTDTDEKAVL